MSHRPQFLSDALAEINERVYDPHEDVLQAAKGCDYSDSKESLVALSALLLQQQYRFDPLTAPILQHDTPVKKWLDSLPERHRRTIKTWVLGRWRDRRSRLGHYLLFLYNMNYGNSRKVLNVLVRRDIAPPQIHLLLANIAFDLYPLSLEQKNVLLDYKLETWADYLNDLFGGDKIEKWMRDFRPDHQYDNGIRTNTVIGVFDRFFAGPYGFAGFNREADVFYDLGGGYNTPEMNRVTGLPFTCLDTYSPRNVNSRVLICKMIDGRTLALPRDERDEYVKKLQAVDYTLFDVCSSEFPSQYSSYGIVTTGFLLATPYARQATDIVELSPDVRWLYISVMGIHRILQLISRGKSVDLFSVQRGASRPFCHDVVFLRWRNHRLTDCVLTEKQVTPVRIDADETELLTGRNSPYISYLPR